jgi:hypothetical protein
MGKHNRKLKPMIPGNHTQDKKVMSSLLDVMEDNHEFESLLKYNYIDLDIRSEIRRAIKEIENIRNRPLICYVSNVVRQNVKAPISINSEDDLPFTELLSTTTRSEKGIDILLVTPGGSAQQVDKFVNILRSRFDNITFILPNVAMSAGSIFIMSGDNIIMSSTSYFGPIDPQVPNKDGQFVPAQTLLALISDIQERGETYIKKNLNPLWTDIQILKQIDPKDLGNALTASQYSMDLTKRYLSQYKFKSWAKHSDGRDVSDQEKTDTAFNIAKTLCDHKIWKTHGYGITREIAESTLHLKIEHPEETEGLDRAIRRMWALLYWVFENTLIYKIFISDNYSLFKNEISS